MTGIATASDLGSRPQILRIATINRNVLGASSKNVGTLSQSTSNLPPDLPHVSIVQGIVLF